MFLIYIMVHKNQPGLSFQTLLTIFLGNMGLNYWFNIKFELQKIGFLSQMFPNEFDFLKKIWETGDS